MLERTKEAGQLLRPASLLEALRERTRELHTRAERSGFIADMLHGRATRHGYRLMLQNLLPVYRTLEAQLAHHAGSTLIGPLGRPELVRAGSIAADLLYLSTEAAPVPMLPATARYVAAIEQAGAGDGDRLIAHAYARYLGDLSGGQIVKRLLAKSLELPPAALSFYDFPDIRDLADFKAGYRSAIDRAGDESESFDAIVEEGALAFELNIELAIALRVEAARVAQS